VVTLSVDEDYLEMVNNRICLTWYQKYMISVYQLLLWMV